MPLGASFLRSASDCARLQNESAPKARGAPFRIEWARLRGLGLEHLGLAVADRNPARLLGLRNLANEIDVQETVLERGALYLDVIGKLEHALEGAGRNAPV